jgi:hypothetical protein
VKTLIDGKVEAVDDLFFSRTRPRPKLEYLRRESKQPIGAEHSGSCHLCRGVAGARSRSAAETLLID